MTLCYLSYVIYNHVNIPLIQALAHWINEKAPASADAKRADEMAAAASKAVSDLNINIIYS
jgi:hypothetical protein